MGARRRDDGRMKTIAGCRSCGTTDLQRVLYLGEVPLANALLTEERLRSESEPRFPLTLAFCPECSLLQILETVEPEVLFRDYVYFSSFSDTMLRHAKEEAGMLRDRLGLGGDSLAVELASNDGYLLKNFVDMGVPVLGIEPARNIATVAERNGVRTVAEFFDMTLARRLRDEGTRADVVIGNNVLAHVADLAGFVGGAAHILKDEGLAVFEFPYVGEMIEKLEFDTIYHEHLCYYSLHSVSGLLERNGLRTVDVERHDIHGGSLRVFAARATSGAEASRAVEELLEKERAKGMTGVAFYGAFAERVSRLKDALLGELRRRKEAGQRLAAYGASAKGSTLLNFFGIDGSLLDFIADRSTAKQGKFAPGNHLPIVAPEALAERRPDAVLLLTWNFADEILKQQSAYLSSGGQFIIPVPQVRTVGKEALA